MELGRFYVDLFYIFHESYIEFQTYFIERTWIEWLLFFFPFYIFGEFPRYVLPAFALPLLRLFGLPRPDLRKKIQFLDTFPSVSILLVGYNEEDCIVPAIRSLLELDYPNLEIIVVDDGSTDRMYEMAYPFAARGKIRLYKNRQATGRSGRPSASNLALSLSHGDYIVSVDADTSFDRDILLHMIGPFYDETVGAVAGNIKPRNTKGSLWAKMQAIEYLKSLTLWKAWLNVLGMNMQASGAFGAFRRTALMECGAWSPELAEDADLSLKVKRSGWRIVFAPEAVSMTTVPDTARMLVGQRYRWDKGLVRTYFHKHKDLSFAFKKDWRTALEMCFEYFFSIFMTIIFPFWLMATSNNT